MTDYEQYIKYIQESARNHPNPVVRDLQAWADAQKAAGNDLPPFGDTEWDGGWVVFDPLQ